MNINFYMTLAIKEAKNAGFLQEVTVGAIIVDNQRNKVIASAHNEVFIKNDPTKHAEMILIEKTCKKIKSRYLENTSIFITLEPCAMCAAAISEARISKIYFGAYDDHKGSLESIMNIYKSNNLYVPEYYGGVKELDCSTLLKKFFKKKRKICA